jgi:hypothetical protein
VASVAAGCSVGLLDSFTAKPRAQQCSAHEGETSSNNNLLQLLLCQPSAVDATLWDLQHQLPPAHQLRTDTLARLVQLHFSLAKRLNTVTSDLLQAQGTNVEQLLLDASAMSINEATWQLLYNLMQVELFHLVRAKGLQREHKERLQYSGRF